MKSVLCIFCVLLMAGCGAISDIKANAPEPEATGDPIYDSQSEVRLLVPWDWMVYDVKNIKKKPMRKSTGDYWY